MHIQYIYIHYTHIKYQIIYIIILNMTQFLSNLLDPLKIIQKIWVFEYSRIGMRTSATATFLSHPITIFKEQTWEKHRLPETNSEFTPEKWDGWKTILLGPEWPIFRGKLAVSFMEGNSRFLQFLPRLRHLSGQRFGKTHGHHLLQQLLLHGGWHRRSQHGNIWKGPPPWGGWGGWNKET